MSQAKPEQPNSWQVIPTTCIVKSLGDLCRLELKIKPPANWLNDIAADDICFLLEKQIIQCFSAPSASMTVNVELASPSQFDVVMQEQVIHSQLLDVQSMTPVVKRKRVRNPWSLF